MTCLRLLPFEARSEVTKCPEEGCEFEFHIHPHDVGAHSPVVKVLEHRLRINDATNCKGTCSIYGR